jgi:hypothetical protein
MNMSTVCCGTNGGVADLGMTGSRKAIIHSICAMALAALSLASGAQAQTVLYSEMFEGVHGWTLNVASGVNGADPNFWTVSDNEGGVSPPGCGVAANGDKTLHVTAVFNPTGGAAYDTGGLCGFLFCPQANMRAESPSMSTVGQNSVSLAFDYIANGDALIDNASVLYNIGLGWVVLTPSLKSPVCGSGTGQWTHYETQLPAEAGDQPSLKIAINWTNNDDGVGTDPSVAINNVQVFTPSINLFADGFEATP